MITNYLRTQQQQQCYGCRACEQICPKGAISIHPNEEGFLYPVINQDLCIDCGLCAKICPYDTPLPMQQPLKAYAIQYKDKERLSNSSSGAAFPAIADYVLNMGGYVAGCIFNDKMEAIHIVTNQLEMVEKMSGSKYVQSNLNNVFTEIKQLLVSENLVLFSGTPCQVAGLCRFLHKPYDNLIAVDLICHGVPSPALLQDYLTSTYNGKVVELKFRNKKLNGWRSQGSVNVQLSEGKSLLKKTSPFIDSYYYYYYLQNSISRICCYECSFSTIKRVSDLTIGDYWNVRDVIPSIKAEQGISAILINTSKGEDIYKAIKSSIYTYDTSIEDVVKGNGNLQKPCDMPKQRLYIYDKIKKEGYANVANQECHYQYVIPFVKRLIPSSVKRTIKKIIAIIKR